MTMSKYGRIAPLFSGLRRLRLAVCAVAPAVIATVPAGCETGSTVSLPEVPAALTDGSVAYMVQTVGGCRRAAVTVGLTKVDPAKWGGWDGDCPGADLDEARIRNYVDRSGAFSKRVSLRDLGATKYSLVSACVFAAQGLKRGDLLFVSISGHGGEAANSTPGEAEANDQYACLADGPLYDDTIWLLLTQAWTAVPGLRVALYVDTCNSRTMFRGVPHDYAAGVQARMKTSRSRGDALDGGLLVISGCDDGKSSYGDAVDGGILTYAGFAQALPDGKTWATWFKALSKVMPATQRPFMSEAGTSFKTSEAMR